jgi:hypothetical protein
MAKILTCFLVSIFLVFIASYLKAYTMPIYPMEEIDSVIEGNISLINDHVKVKLDSGATCSGKVISTGSEEVTIRPTFFEHTLNFYSSLFTKEGIIWFSILVVSLTFALLTYLDNVIR